MGAGLTTALAIGAALFLTIVVAHLVDEDLFFVAVFGAFILAFMGAALVGAIIGLATGARSREMGSALGAGLLCGILGHVIILVATFSAFGVVASLEDGSASDFNEDTEGNLEWSEFGKALLFLLPAGLVGAVVAAATATPRVERHEHLAPPGAYHADEPWRAPEPAPVPSGAGRAAETSSPRVARTGTPRLRCPRCHTIFDPVAGHEIVCPTCGFTG
jgi:hypothetical protein